MVYLEWFGGVSFAPKVNSLLVFCQVLCREIVVVPGMATVS